MDSSPDSLRKKAPRRNNDPAWERYILTLEPDILKIANKYTTDEALRQDCEQEARMALLTVFPQQVRAYKEYVEGAISEEKWLAHLNGYCRRVIRNAVLSYLHPVTKGNWYIGRSKRTRDPNTGKWREIRFGPRYTSMDEMTEYGFDISTEGEITWDRVSRDGLLDDEGRF